VGPSIAGVLAEYASWRLVFLAIVPLIAAAGMLTVPALRALGPPPNAQTQRPTQVPVSALLAVGAGLLLTGLTTADTPFGAPLVVAGIAVAWRPFRRLMPPGTFSARRGLPAAVAGIAVLNFVFFGADSFIPLMLTDVRDQSTVVAGLVLTAATLTWTAGTWVMERAGERVGRTRLIALGFALVGAGIALVVPVVGSAPVALAVAAWGLAGLGMGMAYPGLSLAALDATPPGTEGASGTSVKLAEFLATAMAAGLAGAIVGIGESHGWLAESLNLNFGLMVLACVPGLYAVSRLARGRIESPAGDGSDRPTPEPLDVEPATAAS
jgi:MFS family permease